MPVLEPRVSPVDLHRRDVAVVLQDERLQPVRLKQTQHVLWDTLAPSRPTQILMLHGQSPRVPQARTPSQPRGSLQHQGRSVGGVEHPAHFDLPPTYTYTTRVACILITRGGRGITGHETHWARGTGRGRGGSHGSLLSWLPEERADSSVYSKVWCLSVGS